MLDGPGVHFRPLLLAVVDDLDARTLEQSQRVTARPAAEFGLVHIALLEGLDKLLVAVDAQLLAPSARVLDVACLQRCPRGRLHQPRRLGERTYLMG